MFPLFPSSEPFPSGVRTLVRTAVLAVAGVFPASALCQAVPKPILTPAPAADQNASPAPTAAPPPAALAPADASRYVIAPDDMLQVTVWKEPTLSGSFPVRPDGMISLVLLGDVRAAGMTPMQLGKDISGRLEKYVQNPIVTVVVSAVNSQRIFVVGEVGHIGPIQLTPGMTPLQAIASAGGLSPYASMKHIYILRGSQGKQTKIPYNYKAALNGDNQQNVSLLPGDTIVVK